MFDKYEQYEYRNNSYYQLANVLNIMGGVSGTLGFYVWFFNEQDLTNEIFITAVALGIALVFLSGALHSYGDDIDEEWTDYRGTQNYFIEESKKSHQSVTPHLKPKEQLLTKESHPNVVPLKRKSKWPVPPKKT